MPEQFVSIAELGRHEGREAELRGWLAGKRRGGKIVFLQVRDGTGLCQCVVEASTPEAFAVAGGMTLESSLRVSGTVRRDDRAPGGWEVAVAGLRVIGASEEYPITRKTHGVDFLMSHRHLWLRSSRPAAILRIRDTFVRACRDFFARRGFTLVDTPILVRGAGEDAQTLFPVRYFDERAFLAQTGQLYLESACMALGKVYCFGPTFRAEKSKTRRHLTEFWMVEPEVAFAGLDELVELAEDMVCHVVREVVERHADALRTLGRDVDRLRGVKKPFHRITYSDAVETLRSAGTRARLEREAEEDRGQLARWIGELEAAERQAAQTQGAGRKDDLEAAIRDLREKIADAEDDLGRRREHMEAAQGFQWGKDLGGSDETILSRGFDRPVFVTRYPREAKAFYMKADPSDGRVVLNMDLLAPEGYGEIVGGSQREDDMGALLARMAEKGLDPADYGWYLDLRRYGTVPHGGFGLGVERTLAWICGLRHVREAIPFPRTMGRMDP
jgi:asparaginyl-tRNA synthetase